jgi:hypothetical protein
MATSKSEKRGARKPASSIVPARIRADFPRGSVCVDVNVADGRLAELAELTATKPAKGLYFAASPSNEPDLALVVQQFKGERANVHVTVEYRSGVDSPFPRVSRALISKVLALLMSSSKKELCFAEFSREVSLEGVASAVFTGDVQGAPPAMRLVGLEFEVPSETGKATRGTKIRYVQGRVIETHWCRERRPVTSFQHAFEIARESENVLPSGEGK